MADRSVFERPTGKSRLNLLDLLLDGRDDGQRVLHVSRNDDTADRGCTLVIECAATQGGTQRHTSDVANPNRRVFPRDDHCRLEVVEILDEAQASHDVLDAIDLQGASADVEVALTHCVGDLGQADPVRPHRLGIYVDLILSDEAADRRHFADAFDGLQCIADRPVLNRSQLVGIPAPNGIALRILSFERVPEDLPECGRVGAKRWRDAVGHRPRWQ